MKDSFTDALNEIEDKIERFVGDEIDEAKMLRLNKMRNICREICELNNRIKAPFTPFDSRSINSGVKLLFPTRIYINSTEIVKKIASLYEYADTATVALLEDGSAIQLYFIVNDMWVKYHYKEKK